MIPSTAMTNAQKSLILNRMAEANEDIAGVEKALGFPIGELTKSEASSLIDCLVHDGDLDFVIGRIVQDRQGIPAKQEPHGAVQNSEKSKFTVEPGSELAIAKIAGLPPEMANLFFMKLNGNAYIKVAGLQYMAGKIGYRRIEIIDNYDEKSETWTAEAKIYPKIDNKTLEALSKLSPETQKMAYEDLSKPTNGIGTASKENVQNRNMHQFLREMAQTRALGRALRSYTGYGGTSYEELPDAEISGDVP
jgi:hypothetical protein